MQIDLLHSGISQRTPIPEKIQEVLLTYLEVFAMPMGLFPLRGKEHQITLKEGTNPIRVCPYRYQQIQKAKIDKMVEDMWLTRIFNPPMISVNLVSKMCLFGPYCFSVWGSHGLVQSSSHVGLAKPTFAKEVTSIFGSHGLLSQIN